MLFPKRNSRGLSSEDLANVFSSYGSDLTMRTNFPDEEDLNVAAENGCVLTIPKTPKRPRSIKPRTKKAGK